MAFPLSAPNLTNAKLRRTFGEPKQYQIDSYWGLPAGQPPLVQDATTGLVRPFSSYKTIATAAATFVGFATDTFVPGEEHSVWVHTAGWVELKLDTAASFVTGDWFKPVLIEAGDDDYVSDDTVTPATMPTDAAIALFRAVQSCVCQPFSDRISCPGAIPVAVDSSPSSDVSRQTQRTVLASFGILNDHN